MIVHVTLEVGGSAERPRHPLVTLSALPIVCLCLLLAACQSGSPEPSQQAETPATSHSTPGHGPAATNDVAPTRQLTNEQMTRVVDRIWERIYTDGHYGVNWHMVRLDPRRRTVVVWRHDRQTGSDPHLAAIATRAGIGLEFRPMPDLEILRVGSPAQDLKDTVATLADHLTQVAISTPGYGYTSLVRESPLRRIVLWRTTPQPSTDAQLLSLARRQGIALELRTARYSAQQLAALATLLRAQNPATCPRGWVTQTIDVTPYGARVIVFGDRDAARASLAQDPRVLAVTTDPAVTHPTLAPPAC